MTIYIQDSFTASDGSTLVSRSGEVGATWAMVFGGDAARFVIHSNKLRRPTYAEDPVNQGGSAFANASATLPAQFVLEAGITAGPNLENWSLEFFQNGEAPGNSDTLASLAGYVTTSNVSAYDGNVGFVNGDFAFSSGVNYVVKVVVSNLSLELLIDDVSIVSVTLAVPVAGKLGINIYHNGDYGPQIDYITVSTGVGTPQFWTSFVGSIET